MMMMMMIMMMMTMMMPPKVRLVFSGFTPGALVRTGAALSSCATPDNPCRQAYIEYMQGEDRNRSVTTFWSSILLLSNPRASWDPLTLVAAVRGASGIMYENQVEIYVLKQIS